MLAQAHCLPLRTHRFQPVQRLCFPSRIPNKCQHLKKPHQALPTFIQAAPSAPSSMIVAAAAGLAAVAAVVQFVRLLLADCDLRLLTKGLAPAAAFEGKVIWITGASQGMGRLLATYFARRGAKLILSSRTKDKLQAVKDELSSTCKDIEIIPLDLCGPYAGLEAAAAAADGAFNGAGVDYLVHNAGASMSALASEVSPEVTDALFGVNTLGPIKLTRAALPSLLARNKARIVVVASMAGKVPSPGQAIYSACKMGLYGYFATLATELADTGVKVTICCPGPVAAAEGAAPRSVYGATGLVNTQAAKSEKDDKARMKPERCVELIAAAAAHGVDEAWISKQPVLAVCYIFQLLPSLGWALLKKLGPKRARALKEGKSGYDVRNIALSSGTQDLT